MQRTLILFLLFPTSTHSLSFPGFTTIVKVFKANKAVVSAKARTTASTSSTTACKSDEEAQKELLEGNIKNFMQNHSTITAGTAATGSTFITNYFMKTDVCKKWVGQLPQLKHRYLKGAPEFCLSILIGMITFQAIHAPAEIIDELLDNEAEEKRNKK